MKIITPKEEFNLKKSNENILCECLLCKKIFEVLKKEVTREVNKKRGYVKFCSKSCSSKYTNAGKILKHNTRNKISNSLLRFNEDTPKALYKYKCGKCNECFEDRKIRSGRKITCEKCRKKRVVYDKNNINSIYEVSSRTMQKIIKKAKIKCALCDWDKTVLDIHHINGRKIEDANNHRNLICLCPNCHRLAHENKIEKEELQKKSLDNFLINWKHFYNDLSKNGHNKKRKNEC